MVNVDLLTIKRKPDGTPAFIYPSNWNGTQAFEAICEKCCLLQEELNKLKP